MRFLLTIISLIIASNIAMGEVKEKRIVAPFNQIVVESSLKVILIQSDEQSVIISTETAEEQEKIKTEVVGDKIVIGDNQENLFSKKADHNNVTIEVRFADLNKITISSKGEVINGSPIALHILTTVVNGKGSIKLRDADLSKLNANITGSGTITINNNLKQAEVIEANLVGNGIIDLSNFRSTTGDIDIVGSGEVKANIEKEIDVTIKGSGNLHYRSNPAVRSSILGKGQILKIN